MSRITRQLLCVLLITQCINSAVAQSQMIGDKSYYEVNGKVKQISCEYGGDLRFNKNGQSLCIDYTSTKKKGKNVEYIVTNSPVDEITTYDSKGRLVKYYCFEFTLDNLKYDSLDRLIYYESFSEGWLGSVSVELFYDSTGYCIKKIEKEYEYECEYEENTGGSVKIKDQYGGVYGLVNTVTYTYVILEKDSMGNWTKRKRNDGIIETRQISYYQ